MMKNTDLLQLSQCACFNLRKTTRRVTQAYDSALRPTGLRTTQFSLLAYLKSRSPIPISVLADEMELERTTLSRNLGPLREAGLLTLRPGRDARVQEVSITEAGRRRHEEALPLWADIQQRVADLMGPDVLNRLLGDLAGVRTAVSGAEVSKTEDLNAEVQVRRIQVKRFQGQRLQVLRVQVQRSPDGE